MDKLAYGITEDQQTQLFHAKHLTSVLADLSLNGYNKDSVRLNPESLGVVFSLLRDMLSIDYHSL